MSERDYLREIDKTAGCLCRDVLGVIMGYFTRDRLCQYYGNDDHAEILKVIGSVGFDEANCGELSQHDSIFFWAPTMRNGKPYILAYAAIAVKNRIAMGFHYLALSQPEEKCSESNPVAIFAHIRPDTEGEFFFMLNLIYRQFVVPSFARFAECRIGFSADVQYPTFTDIESVSAISNDIYVFGFQTYTDIHQIPIHNCTHENSISSGEDDDEDDDGAYDLREILIHKWARLSEIEFIAVVLCHSLTRIEGDNSLLTSSIRERPWKWDSYGNDKETSVDGYTTLLIPCFTDADKRRLYDILVSRTYTSALDPTRGIPVFP